MQCQGKNSLFLHSEPGVNIEFKEVKEGGQAAPFPCVISDVNNAVGQGITYNAVKFETSILIKDVKRKQFRKYQICP